METSRISTVITSGELIGRLLDIPVKLLSLTEAKFYRLNCFN